MSAWAIGLDGLMVLVLVLGFSNSGKWLGPKPRHQGDADEPYETGMLPLESGVAPMAVLYYRFAVLFVVFDVDLAFLLPWAWNRPTLGLVPALSFTVFIALLSFMLAYLWVKGVLDVD